MNVHCPGWSFYAVSGSFSASSTSTEPSQCTSQFCPKLMRTTHVFPKKTRPRLLVRILCLSSGTSYLVELIKIKMFPVAVIAERVLKIISGGGLSINGKHVYCGDYIFSGHTMVLTMAYLVIKTCKMTKWLQYYTAIMMKCLREGAIPVEKYFYFRFSAAFLPSPLGILGC